LGERFFNPPKIIPKVGRPKLNFQECESYFKKDRGLKSDDREGAEE